MANVLYYEDIQFVDGVKSYFGTSSDLEIYHDGTHSWISDQGSGNLTVLASAFVVNNSADSENMIIASSDGSVNLYYNGSQKFRTISNGVEVTGALSITGDGSNAATLTESGSGDFTIATVDDLRLDSGGNDIVLRGASSAEFGRLSNDSNNFIIRNITADKDIIFKGNDGGSTITALTLDMSDAGHAHFNSTVETPEVQIKGANTSTGVTTSSDIGLKLFNTSNTDGNFQSIDFFNSSGFMTARIGAQFDDAGDRNTDLYFCTRANSGSLTEALRIDSSQNATFAGNVLIPSGYVGRDSHNRINFDTDNNIIFRVADTYRAKLTSAGLLPYADSSYDLGSTSLRYSNIWVDSINGGSVVSGSYLPLAGGTLTGDLTISKSTPKITFDNTAGGGLDPSLTATGTDFTISTTSITPLTIALDTGTASFSNHINLVDGKYLMWGGNSILSHSGAATTIGDNSSGSVITIASGNSTFAGNIYMTGAGHIGAADNFYVGGATAGTDHTYIGDSGRNVTIYNGATFTVASGNTTLGGNLEVQGADVTITANVIHAGDSNTYFGFNAADTWRVVTGGTQRLEINNSGTKIGSGARVTTILDEDNMASDSATALATQQSIKAYVDSSTTGVLTYQGTWNASTNSPTLSSGSGTPGYYYIVSHAGSTDLDGITDWAVGDWAVFSDQATDAWQKIDNTAVGNVSGSGANNRLTLWSGQSTVDSDANFYMSGTTLYAPNLTTTGDITVGDDVFIADSGIINLGSDNDMILFHDGADGVIRNSTGHIYFDNLALNQDIYVRGNDGGSTINALRLDMSDNGWAYFNAGIQVESGLYIPSYVYHNGDTNTYFGFSGNDTWRITTGGTTALEINSSQNATFAGQLDVNGAVSSFGAAGTGTGDAVVSIDGGSGTGGEAYLRLTRGGTSGFILNHTASGIQVRATANIPMYFYTNDTLALTLNTSQNATFAGDVTVGDELTITTIGNATADPDKFLCASGGNRVDYRTGAQLLSDIGAASSSSLSSYLPLAGGTMTGDVTFNDNVDIKLGTSNDCTIFHDGTATWIDNGTGNLNIRNQQDDGNINFICDDGSGGVETYFYLDGGGGGSQPFTVWPDSAVAVFGTGHDFRLEHNGTLSKIDNYTGNLEITNHTDDADLLLRCDDDSGGTATYIQLDGSLGITTFYKNLYLPDDVQMRIGTGSDLKIYHNGTNSNIENFVGTLQIIQNLDDGDISFRSDNGSGGTAEYFRIDGGITSILAYKDILMANDGNDGKIKFGASQDLEIFHDGSNSKILNTTGDLKIGVANTLAIQNNAYDENIASFTKDGAVSLFHNNSKKFETTSTGVTVTGGLTTTASSSIAGAQFTSNTSRNDNLKSIYGNDGDIEIYSDNTTAYIEMPNLSNFIIGDSTTFSTGNIALVRVAELTGTKSMEEDWMGVYTSANTGLSYMTSSGTVRIETQNSGAKVTGALTVTGDVLDRDIPCLFNSNFSDGTASNIYVVPFNNNNEATVSSKTYYHYITMPYAGKLTKIVMKNVSGSPSSSFTTQLFLYVNGSQQASSSELTISSSKIEWSPTSSNTFSAGDELSFAYQKSASSKTWSGVSFGVAIELTDYDI